MADRVGLILFTLQDGQLLGILQRRGEADFENNWGAESWAGGLQATCHGGHQPNESETEALIRECEEELGSECAGYVSRNIEALVRLNASDAPSSTFGLLVQPEVIERIRIHPSSGGLKLVTLDDAKLIEPLKKFSREHKVPADVMAMHCDEREALVRGFMVFQER